MFTMSYVANSSAFSFESIVTYETVKSVLLAELMLNCDVRFAHLITDTGLITKLESKPTNTVLVKQTLLNMTRKPIKQICK